ncbi:Uncharacterized conserved protein DUF2373 [Aspergillus sclerotialis]|uniref:Uncharacterized conserved protein DUF2373 n=1 Tax=Aspergillus sclerotialis TaxID=2070753 RepID=A0A3A2Z671_9EURO|nr:Uncharacterized conserved protein DUF2373 [Aspergillus sclerotialis]
MGTTAARVPAWKKLGLKLKYAKETPQDGNLEKEGSDEQNKAEGVNGEVGTSEKEKKGKKRRFDEEEKEDKGEKDEDKKESAPKSKKKKRVSFTADTKVRDGEEEEQDSDQEAGGVSVSSEEKSADKPGIPDQQPTDEDGDDEQSATEVKEKKKKKKEKGKKKDTASTGSSQIHETPILSYLSHYYKYRQTWKFQKNRETHLFKHVLSLEQVPSQYNAALLAYLQGLKSEGAKQRLHQTAEEVVKSDIENKAPVENEEGAATTDEKDGDTPNTTDYDKAVDAFRAWLLDPKEDFDYNNVSGQLDDDTRKKLEKRQRAELMIYAVQGKLFTAEKPKPVEKEVRPKKVPPGKKKRKNRTAIVEISSSGESESSSSSSSDSDSDSESGKPNGTASNTSSSDSDSSSDSSSDSDSDSESTSSSDSSSSSSS